MAEKEDIVEHWEGYVVSIDGDSFTAIITDLHKKEEDQEVVCPMSAVAEGDRIVVKEGAVFEWTIVCVQKNGKQEYRSQFEFRRVEEIMVEAPEIKEPTPKKDV